MFNYDDDYRDRLVQGLRKAGAPEGAGSELPLADYKRLITQHAGRVHGQGCDGDRSMRPCRRCSRPARSLVDVRAATDYENGHIPGSVSLSCPPRCRSESLGK